MEGDVRNLRDWLWLSGLAPARELDGVGDCRGAAEAWLARQHRTPRRLKDGGMRALRLELSGAEASWASVRELGEDARIEWVRLPDNRQQWSQVREESVNAGSRGARAAGSGVAVAGAARVPAPQAGGGEAPDENGVASHLWAIQCVGPLPVTGALPWLRASRTLSMGDHQELGALFRGWAHALPAPFLIGECGGGAHRVGEVLRHAGLPAVRVTLRSLPDLCREGHGDWLRSVLEAGGSVLSVAPLCRREHPRQHAWRRELLAALAGPWVVLSARRGGRVWKESCAAIRSGWPVLALPARPRIGSDEGVTELIVEGATPLHAPAAIWDALGRVGPVRRNASPCRRGESALSPDARTLLPILRRTEVLDLAAAEAELPAERVRATVLELELDGLVELLPGDRVVVR